MSLYYINELVNLSFQSISHQHKIKSLTLTYLRNAVPCPGPAWLRVPDHLDGTTVLGRAEHVVAAHAV